MNTTQQWNALVTADVKPSRFRDAVAHNARVYLAGLGEGEQISTEQLVEALYPRSVAVQTLTGDTARTSIYAAISKLAVMGLEDCCVKGEVNGNYMGRPKRPWLWFSPGPVDVCSKCGQVVPPSEEV